MTWITLTLRKQQVKNQSNDLTMQDIKLSRQVRQLQRELALQKSLYQSKEQKEILLARSEYDEAKLHRPTAKMVNGTTKYYDGDGNEVSKEKYDELTKTWNDSFSSVKEEFQNQEKEIENYYDGIFEDLEYQATLKQQNAEEEQVSVESQLDAVNQELNSIKDAITSDIGNSIAKLG